MRPRYRLNPCYQNLYLAFILMGTCLSQLYGCAVSQFVSQPFTNHPIAVVTAFDQSESAQQDEDYNTALRSLCQLQSDLAQDGDKMITILFAEETHVVDKSSVGNRLDALQICQRQEQQRQQSQVGKAPGTSVHKAIDRVVQQITQLEQPLNSPIAKVLILMIHASETGGSPAEYAVTTAQLKQLAQQQTAIAIIVADAELGRALDRYFSDVSIQVCPATNPSVCIEASYAAARQMIAHK